MPAFTRIIQHMFLCLCAFMLFGSSIKEQGIDLRDKGRKIENVIKFSISKNALERIKKNDGKKVYLRPSNLIINGDSLTVKGLHTRGQTSQYYTRKSFSFSLDANTDFTHGDMVLSMKRFDAISLSMDRYYYSNRLAFELLGKLNLFHLFYSYCDIQISGKHEGIYMVVERPQDWALKDKDSPFLIRRGYGEKIVKIETDKHADKNEVKSYKKDYYEIYKILNKYKGERLYEQLSKLMNLDMYMKWLAFNYFIKNGDYTDEVYFFINPSEKRFDIIPWDYDDIFGRAPHEGWEIKKSKMGDKYLFSSEDRLDQAIAGDAFLYALYLRQLNEVLLQLDENVLKQAFENTYAELYPYYSNPDIIEMVKFDAYRSASLTTLKQSMEHTYSQLLISRTVLLKQLKE